MVKPFLVNILLPGVLLQSALSEAVAPKVCFAGGSMNTFL